MFKPTKLVSALQERKMLRPEQLQMALLEQSVTKESLGRVLVRNGFVQQQRLIELMREVDPSSLHDESVFQTFIPSSILRETRSMIAALVADTVYIGTMSPAPLVRRRLEPYLGNYSLAFTPVNPIRLNEYLSQLSTIGDDVEGGGFSWERLFNDAMRLKASDIHIMPRQATMSVLLRVDGVFRPLYEGTLDDHTILVSRVKDLSKMDMEERRQPQDGAFTLPYSGRMVRFRVSTVPTVLGERMIVRILDPDSVNFSLDTLGITRVEEWRRGVARPTGLCLICGPTGSGKTTTLNATGREINFLQRAIYSAEDPVEYELPFAGQVSINPLINLDFSAAVRNFMRADPDVLFVGEIRDNETARNAVKAATTGHLVLATLHTDDIVTSVERLRDLGIASHELRHLLRSVLVQRLIRVYCPTCKGKGCNMCGGGGFRGREVVSEVNFFDGVDAVDAVLRGEVSWPLMLHDARDKVLNGRTSAAELERSFGVKMEEIR